MTTFSHSNFEVDPPFATNTEMALQLLRNGYHPVWIRPGSKRPGRAGWVDNLPTEESIKRDFKLAGNIGLIQGVVAQDKSFGLTVDIDRNDAPLVAEVEYIIGDPCIQKFGKKGRSFLVRAIGDIQSGVLHDYRDIKRPAGDILAKGKQTVIPPSIHPDTGAPYRWWGNLTPWNTPYQALPLIDESAIKEIKAYLKDPNNPIAKLREMTWKGVGGAGDTHDTCLAAVGRMVHDDWTDEQIHARIRRAKREACERAGEGYYWPAEAKTCQEWIDKAREKGFGRRKSKPSHGDIANIVLSRYGSIIKRDKLTRDWRVFNGLVYEEHATEELKTLVRTCLPDDQVFRSVIDGVESVLRLFPSITVRGDAWDADKHYLNCPDGTYNLKNRERMEHDPAHLITKVTRVSPRFDYQDSLWLKALDTWFGGNKEEIEYVQTLFGLFLTGETKDEVVTMWIGQSRAGKTKMTEAMRYIMGDYAQTATDTAFLDVRYHPHLEEVARMRGIRLVFINEVEGYLNLRRLKSIASGEPISASYKGKDSFEFKPEAKIWFVGNEAPPTKSSGRELQRRFHVYEFTQQINAADVDKDLRAKLENEASFILGWAIDGSVKYYANGLQRSPHVIESTKKYFSEVDLLQQWIEDKCVAEKDVATPVIVLFQDFGVFEEEAAVRFKVDIGRFSQRLKAKGFRLDRKTLAKGKSAVRVIVGLRLRTDEELPMAGVVTDEDRF